MTHLHLDVRGVGSGRGLVPRATATGFAPLARFAIRRLPRAVRREGLPTLIALVPTLVASAATLPGLLPLGRGIRAGDGGFGGGDGVGGGDAPLESALRTHGDVHDGSVADAQLGELVDAHLGVLLIFRGPVSAAARPLLSFRGRPGRFALGHALVCACGTARREGGEGSVRRRVKRGVEGERGDAEGKRGDAEDAFGDRATWGCRRRRADGGEKRRVRRPAADDVCPERREKPTAPPGRVARASRARKPRARSRRGVGSQRAPGAISRRAGCSRRDRWRQI